MAKITLSNVSKYYGAVQALADVSFEVADDEFAVFVGPSGCGKSTLLRSIAGLEGISGGAIAIDDTSVTNVAPSDRDVAMVFQSYALYPHMSVRKNMEFGLKVNAVAPDERERRVAEAANILQLEDHLDRRPSQLSGGQRQRVAIGRAIVKQPRVFLFDEPLSNLDARLRVQMRVELRTLHQQLGATIVYVTHDQVEAMTMADKIVVLNGGRVEQIDRPLNLYNRPATQFVAAFIGAPSMNFLTLDDRGGAPAYDKLPIVPDLPAQSRADRPPAQMGIRPEHITITAQEPADLTAKVTAKESLGGDTFLYLDTEPGDQLVVKARGDDTHVPGDTVGLALPRERLYFFDGDGRTMEF